MDNVKYCKLEVSWDERQAFLAGNPMPKDLAEGFIWRAFEHGVFVDKQGVIYLLDDEQERAALMAEQAGLFEVAKRIREAVWQ